MYESWRLGRQSPSSRSIGGGSTDFSYALSRCQYYLKRWIIQEAVKNLKCSESDILVQKLELSVDNRGSYLGCVVLDLVVDIKDPTFSQTVHTAKMFKKYPITDFRIEVCYRVDIMDNEFCFYNQTMYREILECIRTVQTQGMEKMKALKEFGKQTREEWAKDPVLSKYLEKSEKA